MFGKIQFNTDKLIYLAVLSEDENDDEKIAHPSIMATYGS